MIIYGTNSVLLKSVRPKSTLCPVCGQVGTIAVNAYSKHVHLFWIPIFPYKKAGVCECQHCKNVLTLKQIPEELKQAYHQIKLEVRAPLWQFSGLGLIGLLITIGVYFDKKQDKLDQEYLAKPSVGDVYRMRVDNDYTTAKVVYLASDSIFVVYNKYQTNQISGIDEIDIVANYDTSVFVFSKADLQEMYSKEEVFQIDRSQVDTVRASN